MKIGDEVYIHGFVDEIRQNVIIIRNDGGYFGTVAEEITSRSEIPNTCEDAISRQAVIDVTWEEPSYTDALNVLTEVRDKVKVLPSVTPQQRMGRWINAEVLDNIRAEIMDFEEELFHRPNTDYSDYAAVRHCVEIIDKYKAESEDKDADSD